MSQKFGKLMGLTLLAVLISMSPVVAAMNIEFILDASQSMNDELEGDTKIDIARQTLINFICELPADINVGLRVYGTQPLKDCQDTKLIIPISPINKGKLIMQVVHVVSQGMTPIAYSLQEAQKDFQDLEGENIIILLSDGLDTCGQDPGIVAQELARSGILTYVIGFAVNRNEKAQLQKIAEKGRGKYYEAQGASQLAQSLSKIREEVMISKKEVSEEILINQIFSVDQTWKITILSCQILKKRGINFELLIENLQAEPAYLKLENDTHLIDNLTNVYPSSQISPLGWRNYLPGFPVQAYVSFARVREQIGAVVLKLRYRTLAGKKELISRIVKLPG